MADGGDDNIFVYLGGEQEVPSRVTHAIIDPSVKTIRRRAFYNRRQLVSIIFHDGVEIVEQEAFFRCRSLGGRIKLLGVREIGDRAFESCHALSRVIFGDRLETIGYGAFGSCNSLRCIKMPSVRTVQDWAFGDSYYLAEVEFGINLERIGPNSFNNCPYLQRITIPLKDNLFPFDTDERQYNQFKHCRCLKTVDFVGAEDINNTISSLLLKSWRGEMNQEIDRIKQELLNSTYGDQKADIIRLCIQSVINRIEYYKAEHNRLLKEHMTLLELAIWKAKLDEKATVKVQTAKRAKIDVGNARKEKRITSGADTIIKNVLPFLQLKE